MATELLLGGFVYSSSVPDATALAVTDGVVTWVGSDAVGRALHPDAQIIDLADRFVAPAFVDSHVHLTSTGLALDGLTLHAATSRSDCLARLAAAVRHTGDGEPIWGLGWDDSTWGGVDSEDRRFPTTAEIDEVVGHRPVYLARADEHSAVASTALRRLVPDLDAADGFDQHAPLVAQAHHLVRAAARSLISADTRLRLQRRALDAAAAAGVVAVHENSGPEIAGLDDFLSLADLDHPVAVRRYWGQAADSAEHAAELLSITRADGLAGDLFVDGALGSHTAWLRDPYADDPHTTGIVHLDPGTIGAHIRACTLAGIQAGFHVIGDAATKTAVAAFAAVAEELGTPAVARCAHRLEHLEMADADDAAVLARCGVIASMQPLFDAEWGGAGQLYAQRLGDVRAADLNDFAMIAKAGVALSFSSDSPVTAIDPWATIRAAVHPHRTESGISARAAFGACTRGAWRAGGIRDGLAGTLEPGADADYAVWEVDELVVAGSHAGVQRWSTDPRSRVPALPDVSASARLPRCVRTVRAGTAIYTGDAW
ncbi:amidohydrolase [Gordonia sp. DT30]|uniref:amidohydrolase n=1 Tax=Gordonia sp. DT30 TaxID=3416546 RepID=UPI003CFB904C